MAEANREYDIKDTVLSRRKEEFLARAGEIFEQPKEVQDKNARIAELGRLAPQEQKAYYRKQESGLV